MIVHLITLGCALQAATAVRVSAQPSRQAAPHPPHPPHPVSVASPPHPHHPPSPPHPAPWPSTTIAAPEPQPETCPGSGVFCDGNQCCPGYDGSSNLTFPCPNADEDWNDCETKLPSTPTATTTTTTSTSNEVEIDPFSFNITTTTTTSTTTSALAINPFSFDLTSTTTTSKSTSSSCLGSGVACHGNQCCPGYEGSNGLTFPCPSADEDWNECETTHELPVPAVGDPHVTSLSGERSDLWQTGWSKFVQIPQHAEDSNAKLVVSGNMRPYHSADPCAPSFLQDVSLTGSWLEHNFVLVRAGSLESSAPFAVSVSGSDFEPIRNASGTEFVVSPAFSVWGEMRTENPEQWGPDARVTVTVGKVSVHVSQHTEGRGEHSRALLDLSVTGLDRILEPVGGWLGVDGASRAGEAPLGCATPSLVALVKPHSSNETLPFVGFRSPRE